MNKLISFLCLNILFCSLFSCAGKDETQSGTFDKKLFLTELAEKAILPAYSNLENETTKLNTALTSFQTTPTADNLKNLRLQFFQLYLSWQNASLYEFGPAETVLLRSNLNTFPTSVTIIEANINAGTANLDAASNLSAKGLPAIDYMLFNNQISSDADYILSLTDKKRMAYLTLLVNDMLSKVKKINAEWKATYFNKFTQSTGTDAGSSLSLFVNQMNMDYEILKNPKIGIPAGIKSLGIPQPNKVEAYYLSKGNLIPNGSNKLALAHLKNFISLFDGSYGNKNLSLKAYLDALNAKNANQLLSDAILSQFNIAQTAINNISTNFETSAVSNDGKLNKAYEELQKAVIFLKTDMPSILGVQITYSDADGD